MRNKVILHRHVGGTPAWKGGPEVEVRLYEIVEGKHKWGLEDMNTCEEVWNFFSKYLR
jgi:polyhydroxybutyrate depolymerase